MQSEYLEFGVLDNDRRLCCRRSAVVCGDEWRLIMGVKNRLGYEQEVWRQFTIGILGFFIRLFTWRWTLMGSGLAFGWVHTITYLSTCTTPGKVAGFI